MTETEINPNALSLEDAARLLTKVSGQVVSVDVLREDIEAGAPTNDDGTLHLVSYAAWIVREMGRSGD